MAVVVKNMNEFCSEFNTIAFCFEMLFTGSKGAKHIIEPTIGYFQYCLLFDGVLYDSNTDRKV